MIQELSLVANESLYDSGLMNPVYDLLWDTKGAWAGMTVEIEKDVNTQMLPFFSFQQLSRIRQEWSDFVANHNMWEALKEYISL